MKAGEFLDIDFHKVFWLENSEGIRDVAACLRQTDDGIMYKTGRSHSVTGKLERKDGGYAIADTVTKTAYEFTPITTEVLRRTVLKARPDIRVPDDAKKDEDALRVWLYREYGLQAVAYC